MAIESDSPLRERRLECGLTQAELAARAGVSRQLVAAVEAGHNTPAVDAALGLARALATTVEELFADTPPDVVAGARRSPARRRAAARRTSRRPTRRRRTRRSRDRRSGLGQARRRPSSRQAPTVPRRHPRRDRARRLRPCARRRRSDARRARPPQPARDLRTNRNRPPRTETRRRARSRRARNPKTSFPNRPSPSIRWHLARWQVGLAIAPKIPGDSLEAVLRRGVPIAQRDPAAASQQAFERASAKTGITQPPPGPRATGHIDAARIAATINGAAITTEAAAHAFDLRFLALEDHTVELWLAERWLDHPGANALGDLLATTAFTERVAHFAGYDLAGCGTLIRTTQQR